jgi:acyl-coenzyme A thioesterase PaaI-like protein
MVEPEKRLFVRAVADKVGRTTANIRCELWSEGAPDKLVATSVGVYSTSGKPYEEWLSAQG